MIQWNSLRKFNVYNCRPGHGPRFFATSHHFYHNKHLEVYAAKRAQRMTLRQLIFFGRSMNDERIITSANYVRTELPVRIAHRLRDLQALPYIVVTREEVAKVYELYWSAFDRLRRYPQITSLAENEIFCNFLRGLLEEHASVIPSLALGLSLSSPHLPPDQLDNFLRRMLVSRISRRVLAEHHVSLSEDMIRRQSVSSSPDGRVGIISTDLKMSDSIAQCASLLKMRPIPSEVSSLLPAVLIDGHTEAKFAYVREHFEYIIFELLKNAIYATGLFHKSHNSIPIIRATIATGTDDIQVRISDQGGGLLSPHIKSPSDLFSFSHIRNTGRMDVSTIGALRVVSTDPRGMRATVSEQVTSWQDRNIPEEGPERSAGVGAHRRIGIGLPMSNIFATYFGGSLELVSLEGWGTDVYVRLPKLGTRLEVIEV